MVGDMGCQVRPTLDAHAQCCRLAVDGLQAQAQPPIHTFSSSRVKPRPRRFLVLYFTVWQRTMGFSEPATGRGKLALAFSARAADAACMHRASMRGVALQARHDAEVGVGNRQAVECLIIPDAVSSIIEPHISGHGQQAIPSAQALPPDAAAR
eukprot:366404-Chlamydomonas_euryale.AAC.8